MLSDVRRYSINLEHGSIINLKFFVWKTMRASDILMDPLIDPVSSSTTAIVEIWLFYATQPSAFKIENIQP